MFFFKKHLLLYISNILKTAGNSLGYKHSEVTKQKIRHLGGLAIEDRDEVK
jgi:hypothetical protein